MRFAILLAGLLIGLSIDAEALWSNMSFWFVYPALFAMLYIDLISLAVDNIEGAKKLKEAVKSVEKE